jgi:hypothetical protein
MPEARVLKGEIRHLRGSLAGLLPVPVTDTVVDLTDCPPARPMSPPPVDCYSRAYMGRAGTAFMGIWVQKVFSIEVQFGVTDIEWCRSSGSADLVGLASMMKNSPPRSPDTKSDKNVVSRTAKSSAHPRARGKAKPIRRHLMRYWRNV